eukprot:gene3981-5703_t
MRSKFDSPKLLSAFKFDYSVETIETIFKNGLSTINDVTFPAVGTIFSTKLTLLGYSMSTPILFILVVLSSLVISFNTNTINIGHPYENSPIAYNPIKSDKYYRKKPLFVLKRMAKLALSAGSFVVAILYDMKFGKVKQNEAKRAKQALQLSTQLGPTFIKLGQALSIRTDVVNDAYASELKKLQDAVPPFDSDEAKKIICNELRIKNISQKFKEFSDKPVAAASIGQVYKAKLFNGLEVAVKVQRPNILSDISLDLHVLRTVALVLFKLMELVQGKSDKSEIDFNLSFVDEWGKGLVSEVDYRLEAKNTNQFIAAMKKRGLNAVMSPAVVEELSGSKVLVTEWVNGTRLDRDASADVPRLCGVAVNAYLTMLLDTGVLHCDPHPGNLLRTTDGRLCILDWGMTLGLPSDLQYSLLEFISHINAEDFDSIPSDFVNLGFTPPDKVQQVRDSGLTEGFAFAFKQLSKGGGPKKIQERVKQELQERYGADLSDSELSKRVSAEMLGKIEEQLMREGVDVNAVTNMVEVASKRNREIFKFPPYMLYVTRAFATLEGIGLSINEDYSILKECYPYLAKRLMSDDSPRSRLAMRNMLLSNGVLSPKKLIEMTDGFTSYTASTVDSDQDGEGMKMAQDAITELIMDKEGNMMQDLLLESAANVTDSLIREGYYRWKESTAGKIIRSAIRTPREIVEIMVPNELKLFALPFTLPLTLPYDISKAVSNLIEKDESDTQTIDAIKTLWKTLEPRIASQLGSQSRQSGKPITMNDIIRTISALDPNILREVLDTSNLRKRLPGAARITRRYGATLLQRGAIRLNGKKEISKNKLAFELSNPNNIIINDNSNNNNNNKEEDEYDGYIFDEYGNVISNDNNDDSLDVDEKLNIQLLISILGSLSSSAATTIANALDDRIESKVRVS